MILNTLTTELRDDPLGRGYAGMTPAEIKARGDVADRTRVYTRFASYRTLAAVLDDVEYGTVKAVLAAVAEASQRVADMIAMLAMPGDDWGNGGGVDFGCDSVREMLDQLVAAGHLSAELATKLKALAERTISRWEELGLSRVREGDVEKAQARLTEE